MNPDELSHPENLPDLLVRAHGTKMPEAAPATPEPLRGGTPGASLGQSATTAVDTAGQAFSVQGIETLIDDAVTDEDYATLI